MPCVTWSASFEACANCRFFEFICRFFSTQKHRGAECASAGARARARSACTQQGWAGLARVWQRARGSNARTRSKRVRSFGSEVCVPGWDGTESFQHPPPAGTTPRMQSDGGRRIPVTYFSIHLAFCAERRILAAPAGVRKCSMSSGGKTERPGQAARAETTFMRALIRLARATIFLETSVHLTPFASGAPTATAYAAAAAAGAARARLSASRTRERGATGAPLSYPISFRVQGSGPRCRQQPPHRLFLHPPRPRLPFGSRSSPRARS